MVTEGMDRTTLCGKELQYNQSPNPGQYDRGVLETLENLVRGAHTPD